MWISLDFMSFSFYSTYIGVFKRRTVSTQVGWSTRIAKTHRFFASQIPEESIQNRVKREDLASFSCKILLNEWKSVFKGGTGLFGRLKIWVFKCGEMKDLENHRIDDRWRFTVWRCEAQKKWRLSEKKGFSNVKIVKLRYHGTSPLL